MDYGRAATRARYGMACRPVGGTEGGNTGVGIWPPHNTYRAGQEALASLAAILAAAYGAVPVALLQRLTPAADRYSCLRSFRACHRKIALFLRKLSVF